MKNKRGFTLVELVIVIVLIGILAATALPKFANLTTQARTAANQGVAGGFAAGLSIAHAAWIAQGAVTGGTTVTMDGSDVSLDSEGWPNGSAEAGAHVGSSEDCISVWQGILNNPPPVESSSCSGTSSCYVASQEGSECTFDLYSGNSPVVPQFSIFYDSASGTVTATP